MLLYILYIIEIENLYKGLVKYIEGNKYCVYCVENDVLLVIDELIFKK